MNVDLVWLSPDLASLSYNNAADTLRNLSSALRLKNYSVNVIIYVYTYDFVDLASSSYDNFTVEYIFSPFLVFSQTSVSKFTFIFFDSYRLPDRLSLLWNNICKPPNVKTFYIQHGRYTKLKRKILNKHIIKKSFFYTIFLLRTFLYLPFSCIHLLFLNKTINADFGFLYSPLQYWIDFHSVQGLLFRSTFLIQDRDISRFSLKSGSSFFVNNAFFYIAQTLVEDGRCSKDRFFDFWRSITKFASLNHLSIDIRLHPRSSKKLWQEIQDSTQNIKINFVTSSEFPRYKFVVTHNSAMAVFFLNHSIPVYFFSISSEPLPMGLGDHRFSHSFDDKTSVVGAIAVPNEEQPTRSSALLDPILDVDSPIQDPMTNYVSLQFQIGHLVLSSLNTTSL